MTETLQRSRLADSPSSRIDAEATALAAQAEITLLRKLLFRCDNYLAAVVQEARIDGGGPDYYAEGLRRDIALALSG